MHCEESGNGHSPQSCSLGPGLEVFFLLLHAQRSILVHSGSIYVQTVHISTFGTQQHRRRNQFGIEGARIVCARIFAATPTFRHWCCVCCTVV